MPHPARLAPRRLRTTFAIRLLIAGLVMALMLIGSVSIFLFVSRDSQTRQAAQSTAANRANLLRQLIQKVTEPQTRYAAENLASLESVKSALSDRDAKTLVPNLFATGSTIAP